jgi:hypothetical protein
MEIATLAGCKGLVKVIPVHVTKAHKESRIIAALLFNLGTDVYEWVFSHSRRFNPGKNKELFKNLSTG